MEPYREVAYFQGKQVTTIAREHRKSGIHVLITFADGSSTTVPESEIEYKKTYVLEYK